MADEKALVTLQCSGICCERITPRGAYCGLLELNEVTSDVCCSDQRAVVLNTTQGPAERSYFASVQCGKWSRQECEIYYGIALLLPVVPRKTFVSVLLASGSL